MSRSNSTPAVSIPPSDQWALEPLETAPKPRVHYIDPYINIRKQLRCAEPTMRGDMIREYFSREYQRVRPKSWWQRWQAKQDLAYYRDEVADAMVRMAEKLFATDDEPSQLERELLRLALDWKCNPNLDASVSAFYIDQIQRTIGRFGHNGTERRFHG